MKSVFALALLAALSQTQAAQACSRGSEPGAFQGDESSLRGVLAGEAHLA